MGELPPRSLGGPAPPRWWRGTAHGARSHCRQYPRRL